MVFLDDGKGQCREPGVLGGQLNPEDRVFFKLPLLLRGQLPLRLANRQRELAFSGVVIERAQAEGPQFVRFELEVLPYDHGESADVHGMRRIEIAGFFGIQGAQDGADVAVLADHAAQVSDDLLDIGKTLGTGGAELFHELGAVLQMLAEGLLGLFETFHVLLHRTHGLDGRRVARR